MGAAGNGKSYISSAFGIAACKHDYTVKYVRLPELLDELVIARGEGTLADAILDRIFHDSYKIFIDGEKSMRERYGVKNMKRLINGKIKENIL